VGSLPNLIKLHLAAAWRRKWWATAAVWVTCVLGWLYLAHVPDQFESSARMYVDSDAILVPLLKGIAIDTGSVNQADLMQKTLLSPSNVDKLIEMTALGAKAKTPEERERLNRALSQAIQVSSREKNLFTVTYRDANPELARDVVQAALTIFLANQTGSSQAEMLNAQRFLREQIANYERQLTEAENRRAEFRAKYFDLLPGATNTASRLQTARTALTAGETELSDTRTRLDALRLQLQSIPKVLSVDNGSPLILGSPSIGQQRLAEAERTLDTLKLRFTEAHPDVIAAHKLVDSLRAAGTGASSSGGAGQSLAARTVSNTVYEQLRLRSVDMAVNVASLEQKIAADKKEVERLEALAREAPGVEADFERLDRDYTVLKKNHDELVTRLESAKIASAADSSADSKVRIIDPPRIAQVPIAPKRQVLISVVLLAAIAVGGGIVFLLQHIDQSFNRVQALRQLGLPVLGGISLAVRASSGWRSRRGTIGFIAVTVMLFVVYGGLMLAASKLRLTI
jgi:polysaccharide chain length determinant protein (PEP-CTERM system associated)